jgi:hypothetical protein
MGKRLVNFGVSIQPDMILQRSLRLRIETVEVTRSHDQQTNRDRQSPLLALPWSLNLKFPRADVLLPSVKPYSVVI